MTGYAQGHALQEARSVAHRFLTDKGISAVAANKLNEVSQPTLKCHIFNVPENGGFIVVSDGSKPQILAYSSSGHIDLSTKNPGLQWLLSCYRNMGQRSVAKREGPARNNVEPFLLTSWGQDDPFNSLCPEINGRKTLTGCIATAMAMCLYNEKWPNGSTGAVGGYVTKTNSINMPALSPTSFDWSNLTNDDIARLMLYCGQSVKMDYGTSASGTTPDLIPNALKSVFGYDNDVHISDKSNFTEAEWDNSLYTEISNQRPVIYSGSDSDGEDGHSFILCGYEDGRYYINWGWNGDENGYFTLTNLEPSDNDYNYQQNAILSLKPVVAPSQPTVAVQIGKIFDESEERYYALNEYAVENIPFRSTMRLASTDSVTQQIGLGMFDSDGILRRVIAPEEVTFTPSSSPEWFTCSIKLPLNTPQDTYKLVPVNRGGIGQQWVKVNGTDNNYLELTVGDGYVRARTFPLCNRERSITDIGVYTIDGIRYDLYNYRGDYRAMVLPGKERYTGDLYIPDSVVYHGVAYRVYECNKYAFSDNDELTSLSTSMTYGPVIFGCDNLQLELREGVRKFGELYGPTENVVFPKSTTVLNGCFWGPVKTIRFKAPYLALANEHIFMPSRLRNLTDVYFSCSEPPAIHFTESDQFNPNVTIHIPVGSLDKYNKSEWKDWNLVEDQEPAKIDYDGEEWGYNTHVGLGEYTSSTFYAWYGLNEFAINMPADTVAKYSGRKISAIKFHSRIDDSYPTNEFDYEYVFITDKNGNYLVKQDIAVGPEWNVIKLETPLTITDKELYIGWGTTTDALLTVFNDDDDAERGLYQRRNSEDAFTSLYATYRKPLPLRIIFYGTEATGIVSHTVEQGTENPIVYDICGRKVGIGIGSLNDLPKGIYIVNGKKMIKK